MHEIECELVFAAVGYRGIQVPGLPFDDKAGIIPNRDGRVLHAVGGDLLPRHYVVGWAKRGPSGLIGTNSPDSKATVESLVQDLGAGRIEVRSVPDPHAIPALLRARGVDFVGYEDWKLLDTLEQLEGKRRNKVRHKLTDSAEMMRAIAELRAGGEG